MTEWDFHTLVAGSTVEVPVLDGSRVQYVNLDNAASTPPFKKTVVKYIETHENGKLDLEHYQYLLHIYKHKVKLVAVTGASNVTRYINPYP